MKGAQRTPIALLLLVLAATELSGPAVAQGADETKKNEQTQTDLAGQIEELRLLLEETKKLNEQQNEQLRVRIAELEEKLNQRAEDQADDDLADLLAEAEELTTEVKEKETGTEAVRKSAKGLQRSMQAMNPEISFIGNLAYDWTQGPTKDGFVLLGAELGLQAALDPYTRFKTYIVGEQETFELEFAQDPATDGDTHPLEIGIVVEEAYLEWVGLPTKLRVAAGKFRQQYGTVNRWHPHALPSVDVPFALRNAFSYEGLIGLGVGLYWQLPRAWASSNSLTLQITNADNPAAFAGPHWRDPAFLLRHTGFFDLGPSSYFDLGLNAVWGANDETGDYKTLVAGVDFNYLWEPVQRAKYRGIELRGEWIYTRAQNPTAPITTTNSFYTYLTCKLGRRWSIGLRLDDAEVPYGRFELFDPDTLEPIPYSEGLRELAVTPYLTFWQSEFVRLRLQYQHAQRDFAAAWGADSDDKAWIQVTFGAGPHKHEEY